MAPDSFETDSLISDADDPGLPDTTTSEPPLPSPPRRARNLFQAVCMQRGPIVPRGDPSR